jgi:alkanesulfonate monooxygenase SsuD/methylene tetrahydromethanopterin reductase-like flavin-dependent oxidoreductase (luciferase family)
MPTTFGFGMITAQRAPSEERDDAGIYADVLDLCALAESVGFDAAWLSEHHFVDDGYMPSLLPVAAAIATRTTTLVIGTGVVLAPLYDPIRLAEDAATVDVLSRGRLVLGLGAGYREEEFAGFGRASTALGATLDSTIDTLRAAWGPGTVVHPAASAPVRVTPKPHQSGGPPIWLGARSRAGIRRAATRAVGLIAARVSPDELAAQVALLDEAAVKVGREPAEFTVSVHCPVLAWSQADAWERLESHLHYSEWKYQDMVAAPYGQRPAGESSPPIPSEATRSARRSAAIVGSPQQVAERIDVYRDAAGEHPFHFTARLYWPGMDPSVQREAISVFGEEVIPALRR